MTTLAFLALFAPTDTVAGAPSFRREVMAVLSRAGCNQGACHGNLNGKGGFKLSLRGEDPALDLRALTRDAGGRRADPFRPAESLLLRKGTGTLPHEGGVRVRRGSSEERTLRDWVAAGCPDDAPALPALTDLRVTPDDVVADSRTDRVSIRATATFADGSTRDVTHLAATEFSAEGVATTSGDGVIRRARPGDVVAVVRYLDRQVPVRLAFLPDRPAYKAPIDLASPIDKLAFARFERLRLTPAPVCDDGTFLRRVTLDVTGRLPTPEHAAAFAADPSAGKRAAEIDRLLETPEYADYWALKWSDVLRNEEKALDAKGVRAYHRWIRSAVASGVPLDRFAREVIAARGSTYENPASNWYRSLREPMARAEAVAQVFLGVRLQCARCHNHPFDRWTQEEYHRFTAFFARVGYRERGENRRGDKLDSHEYVGEQVVFQARSGEWKDPETGRPLAPRALGAAGDAPSGDRLAALAAWVTSPDNPFFARAMSNRVWFHLFGRGLVEPNDDARLSNPASHPDVLAFLAADLRDSGFDARHLLRRVLNSRLYQLDSAGGTEDDTYHARSALRPLSAEQLLDAVAQVLGDAPALSGYPAGTRAAQVAAPKSGGRLPPTAGDRFLRVFGQPARLLTCECERSEDAGVLQSFQLVTGSALDGMLRAPDNAIGELLAAGADDRAILRRLTLAALCRTPSAAEEAGLLPRVAAARDRRAAWEDVAWGLVNSKEFLLRR